MWKSYFINTEAESLPQITGNKVIYVDNQINSFTFADSTWWSNSENVG